MHELGGRMAAHSAAQAWQSKQKNTWKYWFSPPENCIWQVLKQVWSLFAQVLKQLSRPPHCGLFWQAW